MGLQGWWITRCGNSGLQSHFGTIKCSRVDYKVRQGLQNVAALQSELVQMLPILSGKKTSI